MTDSMTEAPPGGHRRSVPGPTPRVGHAATLHLALKTPLLPETSHFSSVRDIWNTALARLRESLPNREYRTWFAPTRFLGVDEDAIRIAVPNRTFIAKLENGYGSMVRRLLAECGAPFTKIRFRLTGARPAATAPADPTDRPAPADAAEPGSPGFGPGFEEEALVREPGPAPLAGTRPNETFTFENFVVGDCNRCAHDAALAASAPGIEYSPYNPLVLYGEAGLGKTHLLNAVRVRLAAHSPEIRIVALKGEAFTRQVVQAAMRNRLFDLREWYAGVDVLLVDDIQFISGLHTFGRSTQEFLHALDSLADRGRQMVLTVHRHPGEIENLDSRLRSRLESGLAAEMQRPGWDTRLALVRQKTAAAGAEVPDDIASRIATTVKGTVSELEGVVNRVIAATRTGDSEFPTPAVESLLDALPSGRRKRAPIGDLIAATAIEFGVPALRLMSKQRHRDIVFARQVAMYLAREVTDLSLKEIGEAFRRHHSTVAHAVIRVEHERKNNPGLARIVERLTRRLT